MLNDDVLRLIPCPECDGSGFMFHYDNPNLIGLPPMCPCCHYRGHVSYDELQAWRKKQDEEWEKSVFGKYFKSKEFEKHLDELIDEAINEI